MLKPIYANLNLDFNENRSLKSIKVKQFEDRGREIRLFLSDNGQAITFSAFETATINASVNGTVTAYDKACVVNYSDNNESDNYITVPLYPELTTLAGTEHCEVKLTNPQGTIIYTATFNIEVERSVATSENAEVLQTTELAKVLADHESRITNLEHDKNSSLGVIGNAFLSATAATDNYVIGNADFISFTDKIKEED